MRRVLVGIVVSLFVVALLESLRALQLAAIQAEVSIPEPWPWIVDGFILAMTLVIVDARRDGRNLPRWPRIGLYGATGFSALVQWLYAPPAISDRLVHIVAPVAVLWSFECLLWLLYGEQWGAAETPAETASETPETAPDRPKAETPARAATDAQRRLSRAYAKPPPGDTWTAGTLSQAAKVSRASAGRFLAAVPETPFTPNPTTTSNGHRGG